MTVEDQQKIAAAWQRQQQLQQEQIDCGNIDINSTPTEQIWKNQETFDAFQQNIDPVVFSYFQRWRRENNITDKFFTIETVES